MKKLLAPVLVAGLMATSAFAQTEVDQVKSAMETHNIMVEIPADATEEQLAAVMAYLTGLDSGSTDDVSATAEVKKILGIE
ncbi:hypothetical protein [Mangrovicoccus sp. HB161399]|uniref:hypothetical protein n=1 Tax=Mangrovicoccus sp. HB161399 TaxID=2720392 RepID=UPI00155527FF|nr:hypothetical protein [Mangrovicoccus sp. HB161399]